MSSVFDPDVDFHLINKENEHYPFGRFIRASFALNEFYQNMLDNVFNHSFFIFGKTIDKKLVDLWKTDNRYKARTLKDFFDNVLRKEIEKQAKISKKLYEYFSSCITKAEERYLDFNNTKTVNFFPEIYNDLTSDNLNDFIKDISIKVINKTN